MSVKISTTVNGDAVDFICEPDETLLDVLRNRLGLTGAKEGCGTGDCGACSVTVDGRLLWDKRGREGRFPEPDEILAKLAERRS